MIMEGLPSARDEMGPAADLRTGSWEQYGWDHEDTSLSAFNLENASGSRALDNLVEDKEIAARAVAFVVNSSRKGIVSLCADVATLLRAKKDIETKLFLLRSENESLRLSRVGSQFSFAGGSREPLHFTAPHERSFSLSSSYASSLLSNSPKSHRKKSPRLQRTSAFTLHDPQPVSPNATNAFRFTSQSACSDNSTQTGSESDSKRRHFRKNSLPEIVSEPQSHVTKVNPEVKNAPQETQCATERCCSSRMEEQFCESLSLNTRLAQELGAAKKEIEILKGRIKELEMKNVAHQYTGRYQVEDECAPACKSISNRWTDMPVPGPVILPVPMLGCRCSRCKEVFRTEPGICDREPKPELQPLAVSVGDHVVVSDDRTGFIRYLGHLDHARKTNYVFVGLELDAPVGSHDGLVNGRRYFECKDGHGVLLAIQDIVGVIQESQSESQMFRIQSVINENLCQNKRRKRSALLEVFCQEKTTNPGSGKIQLD